MKNTNWKVPVIIGVGVLAVILMIVFGVQSSQNKAIALEEQVNTASSDIKVQEKRRVGIKLEAKILNVKKYHSVE